MEANEINKLRTQGEWVINPTGFNKNQIGIKDNKEYITGLFVVAGINPSAPEHGEPNAFAITTAVNGTYGIGIDPEKVGEMYAIIEHMLNLSGLWCPMGKVEPEHEGEAIALNHMHNEMTALLTSAKLNP